MECSERIGLGKSYFRICQARITNTFFEDRQHFKGLVSCIYVNCWLISDFFLHVYVHVHLFTYRSCGKSADCLEY